MSTLKSNNEDMTINADGASSEVKFQANGVEKASISSAGAFTSTTIDATALTGNLPAISGASLTGLADNTPSFSAKLTSNQSLSHVTWTKVLFGTEQWDSHNAFDSTTNHRFTVPVGEAGKYCFSFRFTLPGLDSVESVQGQLKKNGSFEANTIALGTSYGTNLNVYVNQTVTLDLAESDYIELYVYHGEGGVQSLEHLYTYFSGFKLIGV